MAKERKKSRQLGLWIPKRILNMSFLSGDEKLFYAYVYSFGERGCWQTDEQIGKALGRGDRSVQRYQANCKRAGLLKVIGKKSKYRKIWAKDHPKFIAWRKKQAALLRQNRQSRPTDTSELLRQNRPTTNKDTNKRTNKQRGGSPSPAEQAHAPLKGKQQQLEAYRTKEETNASIEQLKRSFGRGTRRRTPELTAAERQQRAQQQRRALLEGVAADKKS
ncbi:MAG: hypothetical protein ACYSYV_11710 [Planctomycetota bacterium]|jgi:hypothetical protein